MTRLATCSRTSTAYEVTYELTPIPLAIGTLVLECMSSIVVAFINFAFVEIVATIWLASWAKTSGLASNAFFSFLIATAATVFIVWRRLVKYRAFFGQRRHAHFVISGDGLLIQNSAGPHLIQAAALRRLRFVNTLVANYVPDGASSLTGLGGALMTQVARTRGRRAVKLATICFSIALDAAGETIVLADGLDEVTAREMYQEVSRDLRIRTGADIG